MARWRARWGSIVSVHASPRLRLRLRRRVAVAASLTAALILGPAGEAAANGRYPAAGLIVVDPSDPDRLIVRATYGVLFTQDHGQEWRWACEQAIGFGGYEDPMFGIAADGRILAGLFVGLTSSTDAGCGWVKAGGALEARYAVDLSVEKGDPARAVVVTSNGIDVGVFDTRVWETTDSGAGWAQAGADLPSDFLALTIDPAPSDPARLYLSGRYGAPDYPGVLQRSPDRGLTWERVDIPGSNDKSLPYLSAIDPMDPDRVYVRLDNAEAAMPGDTLLVTDTAGDMWTVIFPGQGDLLGFALSPDGSQVAVGGPDDGLWLAPTSTFQFDQVSQVGVKCLTWTERGLYACADEFRDGFVVGLSTDDGRNFEPLLHLDGICGPLVCSAPGSVSEVCADAWGATALTIGATDCSGAGGGGAGGGGAGSGASTGAGAAAAGEGPSAVGGCGGCAASGASARWLPALISAALAAALARRRRSRRRP